MNIVQPILVEKMTNYLDDLIFKGKIKINGEYEDYKVFKSVKEDNVLRKYLYLDEEIGYVEEAQLLTSMDELLAVKPFSIEKLEDGLVLAFEFTIEVKEG